MTKVNIYEFRDEFIKIKNKFPDAPGLPEGYCFYNPEDKTGLSGTMPHLCYLMCNSWGIVGPAEAALSLCLVTTKRILAYWELQDIRNREASIFLRKEGWFHTQYSDGDRFGPFETDEEAYLSLLKKITQ